MKSLSQKLCSWYATYRPEGWKGEIKPMWFIVIASFLLTAIVSVVCLMIIRRRHQNADTDSPVKKENNPLLKSKKVKIFCLLLSGIVALSSLIFVVIGALPRSDINDIPPATGAKLKIAFYSAFDIEELIRVYTLPMEELIQTDISEIPEVLSQEPKAFASFDGMYVHKFFESDLLELSSAILNRREAYFDATKVKALDVEGKGIVPIRNQYLIACNVDPEYTLILYDTDMGHIVAFYDATYVIKEGQSFPQIFYFAYEDFVRYAQRDYILVMEKLSGEPKYGGVAYGYEDPTGYNPLNVTLITEEKSWNNSHEAILYIIACAILHVALVCAIWYGGYRLYQKKRRSTPPADPNTEEAPKSDTE